MSVTFMQVHAWSKVSLDSGIPFRMQYVTVLYHFYYYYQPTVCRNPVCQNRARFMLDINKSRYVDFQKVRIQETQAELPRGSIPRR